jgi:hypothetical protein
MYTMHQLCDELLNPASHRMPASVYKTLFFRRALYNLEILLKYFAPYMYTMLFLSLIILAFDKRTPSQRHNKHSICFFV